MIAGLLGGLRREETHNIIRNKLDSGYKVSYNNKKTKAYNKGLIPDKDIYSRVVKDSRPTQHYTTKELIDRNPLYDSKTKEQKKILAKKGDQLRNSKAVSMPKNGKAKPKNQKGKKKIGSKSKVIRQNAIVNPSSLSYSSAAAAYGGTYRQFGDAQQTTRITKCEYIGDLRPTSTAFALITYHVNPGDSIMFPWLSSIAPAWEYCRFNSLQIVYKPNCASGAGGTVGIAIDFDTADSAPPNKLAMAEYRPYVAGVPWSDGIIYNCPKRFLNLHNMGKLLIRNASTPVDNTTDVGNLYVMTQDAAAGYLGEMYVEYDVTLINQQQFDPFEGLSAKVSGVSGTDNVFATSYTQALTDRAWLVQADNNTLNFLVNGVWIVDVVISSAATLAGINFVAANGAAFTAFNNAQIPTAATSGARSCYLVVTGTNATTPANLTFTTTGNTGAAMLTYIRFAPYYAALA